MALIDLLGTPTRDTLSGWYIRDYRDETVLASKLPFTIVTSPPSILGASPANPYQAPFRVDHALWRVAAKAWSAGTAVDVASYIAAAGSGTITNIKGHVVTPNAWELFCWHWIPQLKQQAMLFADLFDEFFLPQPDGGIKTTWSQRASPTVSSVTVKTDGSLTLTWTLSFSSMNPQFLIGMTPPGDYYLFPQFVTDVRAIETDGNVPPFTRTFNSSTHLWLVRPLPLGQPITVGVRQVENSFGTHGNGNSAWGFTTTTIVAA